MGEGGSHAQIILRVTEESVWAISQLQYYGMAENQFHDFPVAIKPGLACKLLLCCTCAVLKRK